MTNAAIVEAVRQQLTAGVVPTANQTAVLLAMIDALQAEVRSAHEWTAEAPSDQHLELALPHVPEDQSAALQTSEVQLHAFFLGTASEVRAREQAKEDLRASRERLARIVETNANGIIIVDRAGRITFANTAAKQILNLRPSTSDQLVSSGAGVQPEAAPERFPPADALFQQIERTGENVHNVEYTIGYPDERRATLSINAAPLRDATGNINGLVAALTDITGHKRAEESLLFLADASKLLYSSLDYETTLEQVARLAVPFLADACFVDLIEADRSSVRRLVIAHADPEREQFFRRLSERYPIDMQWPHPITKVLRTGQSELISSVSDSLLQRMARDDEQLGILRQLHLYSLMVVPLLARDQVLGTMIFVSERPNHHYDPNDLALAQELGARAGLAVENARLYCEAQTAIEARDEFLSIASHELKTPTAALITANQLLLKWIAREPASNERVQRELEVIKIATQRLNKLIDSLIEFAHIQTGRFYLARHPVELCQLVKQILAELQTTPRHYVSLICPDESLSVPGDAARLERALYNLIQNAVKYSPRGGPIVVHVERQGEQALVQVIDRGIGIPAAALPQLFQRFYRASNAMQQKIGGMGIGLYLVKEIVTRHGGQVEVNSVEGQGTTFTIRLPLQQ
jgi:PAS domain S-box-containing protein